MAFIPPTLEEMHALLVADYANRLPDQSVAKYSDNWKRLRVLALAATSLHAHIESIYADLLPDGSPSLRALARWGVLLGIDRKEPTAAFEEDALRVTGTEGATVSIGEELTHKDGTRYQVNSAGTVGAGGYVDVDVLAIDTGPITKKQAGEVLTFTDPPAGISGTAELQVDMAHGGADLESEGAWQARQLDKLARPGMGGNANDYRQWALSQPGVDEAYVYPLRNGLGSVDLAFLHAGRGELRLPTEGERDAVQDYIDTVRPISMKMFRVLEVVAQTVNVDVKVEPIDGREWAFDWLDIIPPTVGAYDSATRVLTFSARPTDMLAGDRITYKNTTVRNDAAQAVVESLGPGANDVTLGALTVTLEDETPRPITAPEVGALVYAGGPLVEPLRRAILALFDSLGPGRGTDPNKVAGQWDSTLRQSSIFKVCQLHPGVLETYPVTPTSNQVGANTPPDETVGLVVPGQIIVRRA